MLRRKANLRIRMQNLDFRQHAAEVLPKFVPGPAASLTPPAKLPPPHAQHFLPERLQSPLVARYRVIAEIPANHRLEPRQRVLGLFVPAHAQLLPHLFHLGRHPLADRLPVHHEVPRRMILPTDVSETQKVEGFRFPCPTLRSPFSGIAPKFYQTRLLRMQLQPEPPHALL